MFNINDDYIIELQKISPTHRDRIKSQKSGFGPPTFFSLMHVLPDSTIGLRSAVCNFAYFFKREFSYDFVQYSIYEKREALFAAQVSYEPQAYLFVTNLDHDVKYAFGAACFRWRKWTDHEPGWALQWVWLHPYFRGRNNLGRHWAFFKKTFGDFKVEGPLSHAMVAFLKKQKQEGSK